MTQAVAIRPESLYTLSLSGAPFTDEQVQTLDARLNIPECFSVNSTHFFFSRNDSMPINKMES